MKKALILAAVAAIALSACSKNEILETVNTVPEEAAIGFSNYTPKSLTKVNNTYISGTSLVADKQFAVYAWKTDYDNFLTANPGAPAFMNPAVVTWTDNNDEGANNTYSPKKYWPSGDTPANLSFIAYYPYGGAGITAPTFGSGDPFVASGVGTYAFTAQNTPAAMVDFCVADVVNDQVYANTNATAGENNKGTVNFVFKHQLTKVQFKFKTDNTDANTTVQLVDAKLYNIQTVGTLTATYAQNASPAVNALGTTTTTWSDQAIAGTPVVYDVTLNGNDPKVGSEIVLTTAAQPAIAGTENPATDLFMMVPQTMIAPTFSTTPNIPANLSSKAQYLLVTWDVITDGVKTTNTKALYLDQCKNEAGTATVDIDWVKNNFVTYTITIGPKPILFTAEATSWDAEQNGYYNVN